LIRAALILLAGCGAALPDVPSRGGPAWVELQSDHFTLWTDAGAKRGRELVTEMEHLRQVTYGVAFRSFVQNERSFVIALRDLDEVRVFVPTQFVAFAFQPNFEGLRRPTIVLPADRNSAQYGDVVTHELVHVISHTAIHRQPPWLAEGLAKFFETTHINAATGAVDVGTPPPGMLLGLRQSRPLSAASLFACDEAFCEDFHFYVSAWALYSFLINAHGEELVAFETALDRGEPVAATWDATFTTLPRDAIDRELHAWLTSGKHSVWHFNAKLEQHAIAERKLGDADVYAARALLRIVFHHDDPALEADLAAALALDPQHWLALAVQHARKH
jgi:hypothetical protein